MVQIYVSQLRKVLPPGTLHTRPPGYLLELEPDDLDVTHFTRLRTDGRTALATATPSPRRSSATPSPCGAAPRWRSSPSRSRSSTAAQRVRENLAGGLPDLREALES